MKRMKIVVIVLSVVFFSCGCSLNGKIEQYDFQESPGRWLVTTRITYGFLLPLPNAYDEGLLENFTGDYTENPAEIPTIKKRQMKWAIKQKAKWDKYMQEQRVVIEASEAERAKYE